MAQRIDIMRLILSKLGDDTDLLDPDDDVKAARAMNAVWDVVRDATLRAHPWNFAKQRVRLTPLVEKVAHGFSHGFQLPADFLRLDERFIEPISVRSDYQLEGVRRLLTNCAGTIDITYVRRVEAVGDWDALFVETFAARMAWQIADKITGDLARKRDAWSEYNTALREAKLVDGLENPPEPTPDSSWVTARFDGGTPINGGW